MSGCPELDKHNRVVTESMKILFEACQTCPHNENCYHLQGMRLALTLMKEALQ
jgi:hypothetical protein